MNIEIEKKQKRRISNSFFNAQDAKNILNSDDDIVVYCSNPVCIASIVGYQLLTRMGYSKVRRYAGGIADWEQAGYPLEGNFVSKSKKYFLIPYAMFYM